MAKIKIDVCDAHDAFIIHDKSLLSQLPSWVTCSFSPYNDLCEYISEIEFGEPTLAKLAELWETRCLYNSYPTKREVYHTARRVYDAMLAVLNEKLEEISNRMFSISWDKGNKIARRSKFCQYGLITSWGFLAEDSTDEEIKLSVSI